jgi:hypothetical protein
MAQKMSELECLAVYVAKCLAECLAATRSKTNHFLSSHRHLHLIFQSMLGSFPWCATPSLF